MQNKDLFEFYKPNVTLKFLDELSPEFDKNSIKIRAIGRLLGSKKLAPYKRDINSSNLSNLKPHRSTYSKIPKDNYSTLQQISKPSFILNKHTSGRQRPQSAIQF